MPINIGSVYDPTTVFLEHLAVTLMDKVALIKSGALPPSNGTLSHLAPPCSGTVLGATCRAHPSGQDAFLFLILTGVPHLVVPALGRMFVVHLSSFRREYNIRTRPDQLEIAAVPQQDQRKDPPTSVGQPVRQQTGGCNSVISG